MPTSYCYSNSRPHTLWQMSYAQESTQHTPTAHGEVSGAVHIPLRVGTAHGHRYTAAWVRLACPGTLVHSCQLNSTSKVKLISIAGCNVQQPINTTVPSGRWSRRSGARLSTPTRGMIAAVAVLTPNTLELSASKTPMPCSGPSMLPSGWMVAESDLTAGFPLWPGL